MPKPTLTEVVDQFRRDVDQFQRGVIAAVIGHITELFTPADPDPVAKK